MHAHGQDVGDLRAAVLGDVHGAEGGEERARGLRVSLACPGTTVADAPEFSDQ
jgi:hypothetical protein